MPVFFFRIKTQFQNLGDALINRELLSLMSGHGELVVDDRFAPRAFVNQVMPANTRNTCQRSGMGFYLLMLYLKLIRRETVLYFLNPGGYGGEIGRLRYLKKRLSCLFIRLISLTGVRVCLIGVSYSSLGDLHASAVRRLVDSLYFHSVRDEGSLAVCRRSNIRVDCILPDLAFNAQPCVQAEAREIDVLLSLRQPEDPVYARELINSLVEQSQNLNSAVSFQVAFDRTFCEQLADAIQDEIGRCDVYDVSHCIGEARKLYERSRVVVSNRLHVLLLAMASGAMPVALVRDGENAKIVGLFKGLGLDELLLEKDAITKLGDESLSVDFSLISTLFEQGAKELNDAFKSLVGGQV